MRLILGTCVALAITTGATAAPASEQSNDAKGEYEMARHYSGQTGTTLDRQKAFDFMRRSAEHGYTPAQTDLAFMYYNGNDRVPKDQAQAFHWFSKAATGGSVISQCLLGDFYKRGLGGAPQDYKQAFKWYSLTASKDDRCAPKSQYELYEAYASGHGVQRSMPKAIQWLKRAADANNPVAQARLGRAYLKGDGVPLDAEKGKVWLRKSREGVAPHDDEDDDAHDHTVAGHKH